MKRTPRKITLASLTLLSSLLAACSSGLNQAPPVLETQASTTLRIPIVGTSDDAEEVVGGSVQLEGGLLDLRAKEGVAQTVGLRFQKVTIPQGAKIESAYVAFTVGINDTEPLTVALSGEAADNTATFSTTKYNMTGRSKTRATVSWTPGSWLAGQPRPNSADISSVVQEIVSRSGWQSGNALSLFVAGTGGSGERSAIAYGGKADYIPALVVTYSLGSVPAPTPAPAPAPPPPTTAPASGSLSFALTSNDDDTEEFVGGDVIVGKYLDMYQNYRIGLRFTGVTVPTGAKITSARLGFTASSAQTGAVTLTVKGEDADSAAAFAGGRISTRALTSAAATWQPTAWSAEQKAYSTDLSRVVQEVVSRGGWKSGNALAFVITGDSGNKRAAYARDLSAAKAPVLYLTFETATEPAPTPTPTPTPTPAPAPAPSPTSSCLSGSGSLIKLSGTYTSQVGIYKRSHAKIDARTARMLPRSGFPFVATSNFGSFCLSGGVYDVDHVVATASWSTFHNASTLYFADITNPIVENVAVIKGGDAFTFKDNTSNWLVRNSYVRMSRDDAVENDRFSNGKVDNILVDNAFTVFSCRAEANRALPRNVSVTIQNSLFALKTQSNGSSHNDVFKWTLENTKGCTMKLKNNVFLITNRNGGYINPEKDPRVKNNALDEAACVGNKNIVVFVGNDPTYLAQLKAASPTCFTVTTDVGVWNRARDAWFKRNTQFAKYH